MMEQMSGSKLIRVVIVDDHPVVREGLRTFLQLADDLAVIAEAGTGHEATEVVRTESVDVVLMDLVMPGPLDGVAATEEIVKSNPHVRVIALTSFQEPDRIRAALSAGATSYLQKDVSPDDLLYAIRQAAIGRTVLESTALAALFESAQVPSVTPRGPVTSPFTVRELDVLQALGRGLSNKEIASELGITEKTVKVHVSHILSKLNVYDRTQAVLAASRAGYIHLT